MTRRIAQRAPNTAAKRGKLGTDYVSDFVSDRKYAVDREKAGMRGAPADGANHLLH